MRICFYLPEGAREELAESGQTRSARDIDRKVNVALDSSLGLINGRAIKQFLCPYEGWMLLSTERSMERFQLLLCEDEPITCLMGY